MSKFLTTNCLLLVIILIIASFLRLYNITETPPGLYPDEAMNGNNALEVLSTGHFKVFYPENNGREGLFINIQAVFLKFFDNKPWALRLPSALFGILTVLGLYFLTKELFASHLFSTGIGRLRPPTGRSGLDSRQADSDFVGDQAQPASETFRTKTGGRLTYPEIIALLSSFFLATSFWHINFSRIGFRAIMAPFFLVWAIYFLLKSLNNNRYILYAILSGIFYGLGFYSYIAYRATPLLIFIILLLYWIKNKDWQIRKKIIFSTLYFLIFMIIIATPLGLYFLKNPQDFFGRTTQISIFNSPTLFKDLGLNILKTAGMFNFMGDGNWRHNYAYRPELFWPVGILFLIGIIYGLRMFFEKVSRRLSGQGFAEGEERSRESSGVSLAGRNDRGFREECSQAFTILISWLIIAGLPVVISNEGMPHALRAILMIPPVFILAGFAGIHLYDLAKKYEFFINTRIKRITNIFIFIFLSLLIFEAYNTYFILWGQNPNTAGSFNTNYVDIGKELNSLPKEIPKYVVVETSGVDVYGIPMPAQTIMFITDTFSPEKQKGKNIYYVLPNKISQIPQNSFITVLK